MERLDKEMEFEKSDPHVHMGEHARRCCDHKFGKEGGGTCCHMNGVVHPWNKPKAEEIEITVTQRPTESEERMIPVDMAALDELESKLKTHLLVVSEVRIKIQKNLKENQTLLESLSSIFRGKT